MLQIAIPSIDNIFPYLVTWTYQLTDRPTVEANSDSGGPHRETALQATQHRLHGVASGFLAMDVYLPLQRHRFQLHAALWKRNVWYGSFCWIQGIIVCQTGLEKYVAVKVLPRWSFYLTSGVTAVQSRENPRMGVADCVFGQAAVGCAVLLSYFPIGHSTESAGLSLHPVHNFHLHWFYEAIKSIGCSSNVSHLDLENIMFKTYINFPNCPPAMYGTYRPWVLIKIDFLKTLTGSVHRDAFALWPDLDFSFKKKRF